MDYIFHGGEILTLVPHLEDVEAVLVRDDKIILAGKFHTLKASATNPEIIDLRGKTLLPAFTDAHTHFVETAKLQLMLDVSGCETDEVLYQKMVEYRVSHDLNSVKWINGYGWEKRYIEGFPNINKSFIDKVFPDIPISIASKDLHSTLCNSAAMKLISKFPEAKQLMSENGFLGENWWTLLNKVIPEYDYQTLKKLIRDQIAKCHKMGLCGVHSMENRQTADIVCNLAMSEDFYFTWYYSDLPEDFRSNFSPEN
ncbi:MAG: amidohydrolase family protein, partial [Candidatus Cloacimonetes bacterium]|nr:amidohydrolase family protein [Candidatus Cloacimonadota bacterium]